MPRPGWLAGYIASNNQMRRSLLEDHVISVSEYSLLFSVLDLTVTLLFLLPEGVWDLYLKYFSPVEMLKYFQILPHLNLS